MHKLVIFAMFTAACAPTLPQLSDADREWAQTAFPDDHSDLNQRRGLFADKCSGWHMLVLPINVPQSEWPRVVDKMTPKAKLNDADKASILRYVLTASRNQATQ